MKMRIRWLRRSPKAPSLGILALPPASDPIPSVSESARDSALFTDLNGHVLWGMNGGPSSLAESVSLVSLAQRYGTGDLVVVSRVDQGDGTTQQLAMDRLAELRENVGGLPRLHHACTLDLVPEQIHAALADPQKFTVNGLNHLMIDFPSQRSPISTATTFAEFLKQSITPVIVHPERNIVLQKSSRRLQEWVFAGCVVQVSAQSLNGNFGSETQETAWRMLREGVVHVVASEGGPHVAHAPRLDLTSLEIKRILGDETARRVLVENPARILRGEALVRREPEARGGEPNYRSRAIAF